ncbi:MAG: chemotaxis protein [Proteobacteria bacterium]|nr:chemotaxis protein [Pseudomonadota bacterium]
MNKPLFINWQDEFIQGEQLIDEQHRAVLATINSFHYFLQQGLGIEALMPTVNILVSYLKFHMKTEEGILRGARYPELASYIAMNNESTDEFMAVCQLAIDEQSPDGLLLFLKEWWQSHLEMHEKTTPYIVNYTGQYCRLD